MAELGSGRGNLSKLLKTQGTLLVTDNRAEYLSDRGGLFTGVTQALKENTVTTGYQVTPGFLMMGEWRRDFRLTESDGPLRNLERWSFQRSRVSPTDLAPMRLDHERRDPGRE